MIYLITIIGLLFRLLQANQSFWLDEGASLMFARLGFAQIFTHIETDFHPPFFYLLLKLWLPFAGGHEWLIRLPFILIGTLCIPAIYNLARAIFPKKSFIAFGSAFLLAINPLHIYYSQELRMYSLSCLLVILSWSALINRRYFLLFLFNSLSLLTFYGTIFNVISQLLYLMLAKKGNRHFFVSYFFTATAFGLWIPIFVKQLDNGNYLKNVLPDWSLLSGSLTFKSAILIPLKFIFGRISLYPPKLYYALGGILISLYLSFMALSLKNKKAFPLWIALLGPLLLASVASLKTPMLGYWRFIFLLPFFLLLFVAGLSLSKNLLKKSIYLLVVALSLFFNVYFWNNPSFHREDWQGLSRLALSQKAVLVLDFPQEFAPLHFYLPSGEKIPALDANYQLKRDFAVSLKGYPPHTRFFVMDYLADLTDPQRKLRAVFDTGNFKVGSVYNFNNLGQVYEFESL